MELSNEVKKKVLDKITPSKKQNNLYNKVVEEFVFLLEKEAKKQEKDIDFYIGGSFGKGTYLASHFDVDIFCRCSKNYEDSSLSDIVEEILSSLSISYNREKGSRDYFSGIFKSHNSSIKFELVPTKRISSLDEAVNSTDYSYLHVEFVKKHIEKNPDLINEIRLAKSLLKAKNFYGAESYIGGFSGHTLDLLLIYYQSLEEFLISAINWGEQTIIDVVPHYKSSGEILTSIDNSKHSSLIIVDSILPKRNAAKALSNKMYGEFLVWVKITQFLEEKDFFKEEFTLDDILRQEKLFAKKNNLTLITYTLKLDKLSSEDIAGAKIKKLYEKISSYFSSFGFEIFLSNFNIEKDFSKALYIYHISHTNLPRLQWLRGPPVVMNDAVRQVIEKCESWEVRGKHIWYSVKRDVIAIDEIEKLSFEKCQDMMSSSIDFISSIKLKKIN